MQKIFLFLLAFLPLQALEINFQNLSADFEQQVITDSQNPAPIYKGSFTAKMPNKALWIYKPPMRKIVYINDDRVIIHDIDLKQAQVGNMPDGLNFFEILKRAKKQDQNTHIAQIANTTYTLKIQNGVVASISYKDELENFVQITFKNVKTNTKIDDKIFDFEPDSETDIVFF